MAGLPDILISTPACIPKCMSVGVLQSTSVSGSLEIVVLDEVRTCISVYFSFVGDVVGIYSLFNIYS